MENACFCLRIGRLLMLCDFLRMQLQPKGSDNILRNQIKMIGLDSYSRQVFIYLDPVLIYISL